MAKDRLTQMTEAERRALLMSMSNWSLVGGSLGAGGLASALSPFPFPLWATQPASDISASAATPTEDDAKS